jgi:hypothetical protein
MDYWYNKRIPNNRRSAFGLGWESMRTGGPIVNPFQLNGQQWSWFWDGVNAFRDSELRKRKESL